MVVGGDYGRGSQPPAEPIRNADSLKVARRPHQNGCLAWISAKKRLKGAVTGNNLRRLLPRGSAGTIGRAARRIYMIGRSGRISR
jgi:hypothetical protein